MNRNDDDSDISYEYVYLIIWILRKWLMKFNLNILIPLLFYIISITFNMEKTLSTNDKLFQT